nr:hypothetical protein [Tanacetum cinerariifolium]
MTFEGNTRDLGSFGEETDKITDLHQIHEEVFLTERGDGVAGIKRRRRDLSSNSVRNLATALGRGRLKEDLESSTAFHYALHERGFVYDGNGRKCVHVGKFVVEVHQPMRIDQVVKLGSRSALSLVFLLLRIDGGKDGSTSMRSGEDKSRGARVVGTVGCGASGGMTNAVVTGEVGRRSGEDKSRGARVVGTVGCGASGGMTNAVVTGEVGEDSFDDISMTLVRTIFLGGFLVEDEALEALVILKLLMN